MADDKAQKKRKRHSNGVDGPSKKVAFESGNIKVSFANDGGLHPVLASAPGLVTPALSFSPYARPLLNKSTGTPNPHTHNLILHSSKHPRLDYTAVPTSLDQKLAHYVAVFDPQTKSLRITPAHYASLRGTVRSEAQEVEVTEGKRTMMQQREELGREFGTKKAKKAISDRTVNAIVKGGDTKGKGKKDDVQEAILEAMDIATASNPKKEDVERDLLASKPIPRPNLDADSVEDVYAFTTLLPPSDARLVAVRDWEEKVLAGEAVDFNHRFPARRVVATATMNDNTPRLKALGYLALLLAFHSALQSAGKAGKKVPKKDVLAQKLPDWPADLIDSVRRRFANAANELPKWHLDNLYTHMCALSLFVDGYTTVTADLRDDLGMDNKTISQYYQELGCKMSALSEKERESRHLTKAQAAATRVAKLKLPLEFPKIRSGRRK